MLAGILDRFRFSISRLVESYGIPRDGVLHVGANFGQEADEYDRLGFGSVVWVEGYRPYFEGLLEAIKDRRGHRALNLMVSDVEGESVDFSVASNTGSSTALRPTAGWQETFRDISLTQGGQVTCGRLDRELDRILPPAERTSLRFIVLDIEGSELKALRSLGHYLDHAAFALVEISMRENFEGGPLLVDIDRFMADHGFKRVYIKVSASSGDALYQRVGRLWPFSRAIMRLSATAWQGAALLRLTDMSMGLRRVIKGLAG